ncbi:retrovirus-related pol polyprotein from transposon TNT 1-94 [Tanacetum coccineum]
MKEIFKELEAEVDQNVVNRKYDEIERKNLLIANDNLIVDCLSKEVFYIAINSELTVSRFTEMHDPILLFKHVFWNLKQSFLNYMISFGNNTSLPARDAPDFDSVFVIEKMKASIQGKDNAIKKLRMQISQLKETRSEADCTLDFRALDFQITQLTKKITRAKDVKQTTALLTENENLKAQIHENLKCITMDSVKPKVLAPVSVETIHKIVEEAKVDRSLDKSLTSACLYTKHSQELLEYVIGTFKKVWKPKQVKQVWKATGNVLTSVGYQWRPTGRIFTLGEQFPLTRLTKSKVVPAKQTKNVSTSKTVITEKLSHTSQKPLTRYQRRNQQYQTVPVIVPTSLENQAIIAFMQSAIAYANQQEPNQNWGSNFPNSPSSSIFKCRNFVKKFIGTVRFENDHFGAIMGYGDYVIGDSMISRVYYVEGLGHNLFSVRQFCDSDLEVAFRKHSCYHRHLNHLNFGTINDLARKDLVRGLPRLKFEKDYLCSACQLEKSKKRTHTPKTKNTNLEVHNTLHMDLCGPMRVQTINGKKCILVIVDDYLRFTWVKFLSSKDETPEFVIKFLKQIQVSLNKIVRYIRTNNGTEFVNQVLTEYYESVGIFHQKSVLRTPQQNGVKLLLLLVTPKTDPPFTLVITKPYTSCEDLGKLQPTADIGIFVGYAPCRKGYIIYNKRTRRIMKTIHVQFDELFEPIDPVQLSTGPAPMFLMPGQISSGLVPNLVLATPYVSPTNKELEILFQLMFDKYLEPPRVKRPVSPTLAVLVPVFLASTPSSTTIDQDTPFPSHSPSSLALQSPSSHHGAAVGSTIIEDNPFALVDNDRFINVFSLELSFEASSSGDVSSAESTHVTQPHHHLGK